MWQLPSDCRSSPDFSSRWHLLTARSCPFLISFKEMSICHFFISHSPQGRWVFLNRGELVRVIFFLPAKQREKEAWCPPPNPVDFHSLTQFVEQWDFVTNILTYVHLYQWVKALCASLLNKNCISLVLFHTVYLDPEFNHNEQIWGELDIKLNRSTGPLSLAGFRHGRRRTSAKVELTKSSY